ncbi:potassium channel protein [Gangjinia marincola]|uniref:Potassium channel protein n=1 Tax=Gangjinia marincola TaxID=578463 RepID=A0ABN1MEC5_9FLAO
MFGLIKSRIYVAILLMIAILIYGTVGYKIIMEFSWIDSIYMTVITISTVGFREVGRLSDLAKLFTVTLIVSSVVILGYAVKVISEYFISQNSVERLKKKQLKHKINQLKQHVIVCGYGRNGKQAVQKLKAYGKSFVIIERDEEVIERNQNEGLLFVKGNANEDEILEEAGILEAGTLISALPKDADNLFVVLSARQLNKDLQIISRASEDTSYKKIKLAGADNVIMPDRIGGDHMASLVVVPDLVEFLDNIQLSDSENVNVQEIPFENVCKDEVERTIREIDVRRNTGCTIIGYKTPDGRYKVNPEADLLIEKGSKLIVIGTPHQIKNLNEYYSD